MSSSSSSSLSDNSNSTETSVSSCSGSPRLLHKLKHHSKSDSKLDLHDETGPQLSFTDLRPGDIVLFKGNPDRWLDNLIMTLSESDCSHTTMFYDHIAPGEYDGWDALIVEDSYDCHGAMLRDKPDGRVAYVRRPKVLSKEPFGPVAEVAKKYCKTANEYAYSDFVSLVLLILFKNYTPALEIQNDLLKIFQHAAYALNQTFQAVVFPKDFKNGGQLTCASFVYNLYEEASETNPDYHLKIVDGVLVNASPETVPDPLAHPMKFIDYVIRDIEHDTVMAYGLAEVAVQLAEAAVEGAVDTVTDAIENVFHWITGPFHHTKTAEVTQTRPTATDGAAASKLASKVGDEMSSVVLIVGLNLYKAGHPDLTQDALDSLTTDEILHWVRYDMPEAWMVLPTDLKRNCPDVQDVGWVRYEKRDGRYEIESKPYVLRPDQKEE